MGNVVLIGVDPGLVTGTVVYFLGDKKLTAAVELDMYQTADFVEQAIRPWYKYPPFADVYVIIEKFFMTGSGAKTASPWSLEVTGAVKCAANNQGVPRSNVVNTQGPDQAKAFAPDIVLKHLGLFTPGLEGHANDAARHIVRFAAFRRLFDSETIRSIMRVQDKIGDRPCQM